jgi:hypothetical protein
VALLLPEATGDSDSGDAPAAPDATSAEGPAAGPSPSSGWGGGGIGMPARRACPAISRIAVMTASCISAGLN